MEPCWRGLPFAQGQTQPLVIGYERFYSDAPSAEGGRLLFNELGCANCHLKETGLPSYKGPSLNGIVDHTSPDWLRAFLQNPSKEKPGTRMPDLHLSEADAEAVLHFLATLHQEDPLPNPFKFTNSERGFSLFHTIGCVACHAPSPSFSPPQKSSEPISYAHIPLLRLKERYDQQSLSAFLYKPYDFRPHGRMPQFSLDREDGGDLAAYLLEYHTGDASVYPAFPRLKPDPEQVTRGSAIVRVKHCIACHEVTTDPLFSPTLFPIPPGYRKFRELEGHPDFDLTPGQVQSLELFLNNETKPEANPKTHLQAMNCLACHQRDGQGGPDAARNVYFTGDRDLGDTGRLPPPLTGIGRKLKLDWLKGALEGKHKVRPYLNVQMPVFDNMVHQLPQALALEDGQPAPDHFPDGDPEAGRKLLGTHGGLNCISCHNWGGAEFPRHSSPRLKQYGSTADA